LIAARTPAWLFELLGVPPLDEGGEAVVGRTPVTMRGGILRARSLVSDAQAQTGDAFGYKWAKRETFESAAMRQRMRDWLVERYGEVELAPWWAEHGEAPVVVDAGCGAGFSALELFRSRLDRIRYVGIDISSAVDVASARFAEHGYPAAFLQADIVEPPLPDGCVDVLFSEGALHHTDSTERALKRLARLLVRGGRFLFYVYRRKGPIREFTDDYVRERLQQLGPDGAWRALLPLSKLGKALGDLHVEVDVPEDVALLGIPAGRIDVQRLFYWHVLKAYYHEAYDLEELNHINYDWFAPRNAHRQTPEDVRRWCRLARLEIEREDVQEAGITVVARKAG